MSIDSIIAEYIDVKARETAANKEARDAKKRADELRDEIIKRAAGRDYIETDAYSAVISYTAKTTIDTAKLYAEFGETAVKELYGKDSGYFTVKARARETAMKTA